MLFSRRTKAPMLPPRLSSFRGILTRAGERGRDSVPHPVRTYQSAEAGVDGAQSLRGVPAGCLPGAAYKLTCPGKGSNLPLPSGQILADYVMGPNISSTVGRCTSSTVTFVPDPVLFTATLGTTLPCHVGFHFLVVTKWRPVLDCRINAEAESCVP